MVEIHVEDRGHSEPWPQYSAPSLSVAHPIFVPLSLPSSNLSFPCLPPQLPDCLSPSVCLSSCVCLLPCIALLLLCANERIVEMLLWLLSRQRDCDRR